MRIMGGLWEGILGTRLGFILEQGWLALAWHREHVSPHALINMLRVGTRAALRRKGWKGRVEAEARTISQELQAKR